LQQVIWNLLSNAIKFTPKGGRVQLRLERINSHVELTVSDTGYGINADFLPHVFERFRQADGKTTRAHGGLGLGLAIVRQLVELHGGTVQVESGGEGQGATFIVGLPLMAMRREMDTPEHRHPTGGEKAVDNSPSLAGLQVVVVDDEADTRDLLHTLLERCGAEVRAAGSATEALALIAELKPDVLVSDIGMPEQDGYELIAKVRGHEAGLNERIPAIALTAYARLEDRIRALNAGFQVHVPKPIEPAELIAVVASLTGRTGKA
jgi:CheY-like chemotaxis protein